MCGIIAALCPDRRPFNLRPGLDAIVHRGPDDLRTRSSGCGHAHLGHVRLALVDPTDGQQPILNEDQQIFAVVNGEFYQDTQLREELLARNHRLQSRSDSEVLVHLYEEHGLDAIRFLRGEFAFILWDQRRQFLWAARDRFGIKPLVYTHHQGCLLLASEVKALLALGAPSAWNEEALFQAASLQYLLPGQTLFKGIHSLPSGCELQASQGEVTIHRYWDMDYPQLSMQSIMDNVDLVHAFQQRLDEAVSLRLRGDCPVAFQLSGGIDSAAVLASAAQHRQGPLDAFTVAFGGAYDEAEKASEIAQFVGAKLHIIEAPAASLATAFEAAVRAGEGLAINGHIAAKYLLLKAVHGAGYKAVLTGEGADEVLAGYAHLRADLAGATSHLAARNQASAGLMLPSGSSISLQAVQNALGFIPTWLQAKGTLGQRLRGLLQEDALVRWGKEDPASKLIEAFDVRRQLQGRGCVEQSLYLWTKLALEGYILRALGDAQEMAHSVEGRVPFLDHELFAWLRKLPISFKIQNGVEKHLLRQAQQGRLPEQAIHREKHPFLAPPLEGPMLELAQDHLRNPSFLSSTIFDAHRVKLLLDRLPSLSEEEQKLYDPVIYMLLSSAILSKHHGL